MAYFTQKIIPKKQTFVKNYTKTRKNG